MNTLSDVDSRAFIKIKNYNKYQIKRALTPWLFLLPGIVFTIILRYYTIIKSLLWSFFDYDIANPPGKFIGFENYTNVFTSSDFYSSWKNTFVFLIITLLISFFIPLVQAIFLSEITKYRSFFTTVYILPTLIPLSINVVLWKWIWHPSYGLANYLLNLMHVESKMWLSDQGLTKFCIVFPSIIGGGIAVLLYLAAILGISSEIYEASKLDGCTGLKKLFYITFPNIKFIVVIQLILTVISTMQILDAPYQFAKGGPNGISTSVAVNIFLKYTQSFNYGTASATAAILLIVIAVITFIQMVLDKTEAD